MKNFIKWYKESSLIGKIIGGLVIGAILGLITNKYSINYFSFISVFGDLYIQALKAMAPLLVFLLVIDSLAGSTGSKKQSKGIITVLILYLVSSLLASTLAVIASFMYKVTIPGLMAKAGSTAQINLFKSIEGVLISVVSNPILAITQGNYLPILFWAAMIGICLKKASKVCKATIHDLAEGVTKVIRGIINLAPFGVMGLIYSAVSTNGAGIFIDYGKLILLLVVVMLIIMFIINPLIVGICIKKNPYPLVFKCVIESGINAFFTRSSAANLPINMQLCEKLKLDKEIYSVTIPLGATINMAGAAAVITIMTLSTAWTMGIEVSFGYALFMCFLSTIAAAGAAGTAGGSLMLIPMACALLNIPMDIAWFTVGVGGTIGVIQDSLETAVNSSSDVLLTASANMMLNKNKKTSKKK